MIASDNPVSGETGIIRLSDEITIAIPDAVSGRLADPQNGPRFCAALHRLGPPTCHPRYMIQHGMNAFVGPHGDGLVSDFDRDKGWAEVLKTYAMCPQAG